MKARTQIVHGGSDQRNGDFSAIKGLAKANKASTWSWGCGKETKVGDTLLIYFEQPHSAIIASAVALKDAKSGKYYSYITKIGNIQILSAPISIHEMREMFPRWKWLNYPRAKQYLDNDKATKMLKRAALKLKTPPVAIKVYGAGFGTPEQNRLVEISACKVVRKYYMQRGYKVTSREKEHQGYDFDVSRNGEILHVEIKGASGSSPNFPITANEVDCAHRDSKFLLAVVTDALKTKPKVQFFPRGKFLESFEFRPLAYIAKLKMSIHS